MLVLVFGLVSCALLWPLNRHLPLLRHPHRWLMGQACGYVFLCLRPSPSPVDSQLLMVGIDGAHWDLVEQFDMPTLREMRQNSIYGPLQADEPFFLPCCGQPLHLESDLLNMGLEAFELKVQMREVLGFGKSRMRTGCRLVSINGL